MGQSKWPYSGTPRLSFGSENAFIYRAGPVAHLKPFKKPGADPTLRAPTSECERAGSWCARLVSMYDVSPSIALDLDVHYIETAWPMILQQSCEMRSARPASEPAGHS